MSPKSVRLMTAAALATSVFGASACVPLKGHQGYVIDSDLVNSVYQVMPLVGYNSLLT